MSSFRPVVGQAAFSLLELMVVLVIITGIATLLLPALNSARSKAREAVCLGQLRQWGIGFGLYADDHGGCLPWEGARDDPDRPDAWYNSVAPYLGKPSWTALKAWGKEVHTGQLDSIFVCPDSPRRPDVRPYWGYGMNYMLINTRGAYGFPPTPRRRLESIPRLELTVFLTDKGATPDELKSHPTANPRYDYQSYWHHGGGNVLFGDAHCGWYKAQRLRDAFQTRSRNLDPELIWVPDAVHRP